MDKDANYKENYSRKLRQALAGFFNWLRTLRVLSRDIGSLIFPLVYHHLNLTQQLLASFSRGSMSFQDQIRAGIRQYAKRIEITAGCDEES